MCYKAILVSPDVSSPDNCKNKAADIPFAVRQVFYWNSVIRRSFSIVNGAGPVSKRNV